VVGSYGLKEATPQQKKEMWDRTGEWKSSTKRLSGEYIEPSLLPRSEKCEEKTRKKREKKLDRVYHFVTDV